MSSFTSNNSNILEDDKISWEKSSYNSIDMNDYEEEYGDIPVLDFNTPKNNYLENTDHYIKKKNKHRHYYLYQKRFNKLVLNINDMSFIDKIKLKYIS